MSADGQERNPAATTDVQPPRPGDDQRTQPLLTRAARGRRGDSTPEPAVFEEEPRLLVPRELTPLPLVEQALPVLELFPVSPSHRPRLARSLRQQRLPQRRA